MSQSIFIGKGGDITTLRVKKGKGVQLRDIGSTSVQRVSEIVWSEEHQKWTIEFLPEESKFCGVVTNAMRMRIEEVEDNNACPDIEKYIEFLTSPLLFDEYEDAVAEEIRLINMARAKFGKDCI